MSYVFLLTFFFSLPLIFSLVAASMSHFLTAAIKCLRFSSNEIGLLCFFIPRPSSFSVIHVKADIKIQWKERIGFVLVVFFLSKSPGGHAIYCRNARVLELQNFTPAYMNGCCTSETDPGFFLGGGALVSCATSTPINHIFFFFAEYQFFQKTAGHLGGWGEGAHPLHPPPRSASVRTDDFLRTRMITKFSYLQCSADWGKALIPNGPEHLPGDYGFVPSSN